MRMSIENLSDDNGTAVPLSSVIERLKRSSIGTEITAVYAVVDPDVIELAAVVGDHVVEVVPLATGVNYLVLALGDVVAEAGIYFPEREE